MEGPPVQSNVSGDETGGAIKKRPRHVACGFCSKAHKACDTERPCRRCVAHGRGSECKDVEYSKRQRKTRRMKLYWHTFGKDTARGEKVLMEVFPTNANGAAPGNAEDHLPHQAEGAVLACEKSKKETKPAARKSMQDRPIGKRLKEDPERTAILPSLAHHEMLSRTPNRHTVGPLQFVDRAAFGQHQTAHYHAQPHRHYSVPYDLQPDLKAGDYGTLPSYQHQLSSVPPAYQSNAHAHTSALSRTQMPHHHRQAQQKQQRRRATARGEGIDGTSRSTIIVEADGEIISGQLDDMSLNAGASAEPDEYYSEQPSALPLTLKTRYSDHPNWPVAAEIYPPKTTLALLREELTHIEQETATIRQQQLGLKAALGAWVCVWSSAEENAAAAEDPLLHIGVPSNLSSPARGHLSPGKPHNWSHEDTLPSIPAQYLDGSWHSNPVVSAPEGDSESVYGVV